MYSAMYSGVGFGNKTEGTNENMSATQTDTKSSGTEEHASHKTLVNPIPKLMNA